MTRPTSRLGMSGRELIWASCGRGILVSQWFTNGTLGASWLEGLSDLGPQMGMGQLAVYASYIVVLAFLTLLSLQEPVSKRFWRPATIASTAILTFGDALVMLIGLGIFPESLYTLSMMIVGAGIALPMVGWGAWCCAVGARQACMGVAVSFLAGASVFLAVASVGSWSPYAGAALQVAIVPLSCVFLGNSFGCLDEERDVFKKQSFDLRAAMPFMMTVAFLGFVFGVVVGIAAPSSPQGQVASWAMGTAIVTGSAFVITARSYEFDLGMMSRALVPLLIICLFLMPLFTEIMPELVGAVGCGGYAFTMMFCCAAYAGIAQESETSVIPLVCLATAADSVGIVLGEVVCAFLHAFRPFPVELTYNATLLAIIALAVGGAILLRDRSIASLWGFKRSPTEREVIESRCREVGERVGLTAREEEIMFLLSQGNDPHEVSTELGISVATVRTHARSVYAKVGVHSQPELMRLVLVEEQQS